LKELKRDWFIFAVARVIFGFLVKEYSSGYFNLGILPNHKSSQKRHDFPFRILTEAIPLNFSSNFNTSLHQKEPFLIWLGSFPLL
jgi:hypothetical protein